MGGRLLEYRMVVSVALSAAIALGGLHLWPFPADNALLGLIALMRPRLYAGFAYAYATVWFTTPLIATNTVMSLLYIFAARADGRARPAGLPPYPLPSQRETLFLVIGEQHYRRSTAAAAEPRWLVVPERGLYAGLLIVGAVGTGKTSACMYPYVDQLIGFRANDPDRKIGGLVLEVKGDFCRHVQTLLARHGRAEDYIEVSLTSPYRYNPLHNDLDAYALAYGIATLMTNVVGRGKEPFWQQASTNVMKFVILLHQTLDDYVTLFQVYELVINPDKLRAKIAEGERRFGTDPAPEGRRPGRDGREAAKAAQFDAVRRWFDDDWMRIESKLRTSIVEGISVFLSLFDDNPRVKYTFCPPKETYDRATSADRSHGAALPPIADLIEQGKVIALNFPIAMNPGLARALGTMLKQDFQRAVLNRIHRANERPANPLRPVFFVCDEYQAFATTGENEPSGDDKFLALARQSRCIPIVATQSLSSLRSTLPGDSWRTLVQGLRTKIFLTLSDDFSAHVAAELCGRAERLKPGYTLTEAGQDARVSMLTGRPAAHRTTVSAAKTYQLAVDYVFQPKAFAELQNAQAIVLPYDGFNPWPPTRCYLKPYYLDPQLSYFDQVTAGVL